LGKTYDFRAVAEPEGGWTIDYPDLPGCVTVADSYEEIGRMAEDVLRGWIQTAYELGQAIPEPRYEEDFSGRILVRVPKSMHRRLVERAEDEGTSLNQTIAMFLERGLTKSSEAIRVSSSSPSVPEPRFKSIADAIETESDSRRSIELRRPERGVIRLFDQGRRVFPKRRHV
jgi:antitoxin HicB